MQLIETLDIKHWQEAMPKTLQQQAINSLETGKLIFLPELAFQLDETEQQYLSPSFLDPKAKNISFNPKTDKLSGACTSEEQYPQLKALLWRFSQHAQALIIRLFPQYQSQLQLGRTSFRPAEISQRKTSYRKDDRLLHVDAFPANPNQGRRILRVFSNINPQGQDRVWRLGEPFAEVAQRFLPKVNNYLPSIAKFLHLVKITKSLRTPYDHIMLQIHDKMKADQNYQQKAAQMELRLPPDTSWIVQTDQVSHAALSGQHVLEQTFYLPVSAMLNAQHSPLKVLEKIKGRTLV